jgi:uncharacterized lipoprotein YbaY
VDALWSLGWWWRRFSVEQLFISTFLIIALEAFMLTACSRNVNMRPSTSELLVSGEIILGEEVQSFSSATIYVRLEDVSRVDALSKTVAEQVLHNVSHQAGHQSQLAINLRGTTPDERASYAVYVHVDVDGDGKVSRGDYISMESYPVLTFGYPNRVTVRVREVR